MEELGVSKKNKSSNNVVSSTPGHVQDVRVAVIFDNALIF
jgi:hypothetical protein